MSFTIGINFLSFITTFDSDWASDIPMVLQLMMYVLFNPRLKQLVDRELIGDLHDKWTDRLQRYLTNKFAPHENKSLCTFRAALSKLAEVAEVELITADLLRDMMVTQCVTPLTLDTLNLNSLT